MTCPKCFVDIDCPTLVSRQLITLHSVSPMDACTYPGGSLSLSQLLFVLNEELKRVAHSPSYVAKGHFGLSRIDVLITSAASPWSQSLNSTGMPQARWQPSASGRTLSLSSTASRWISFPSFLSTSLPRGTVSTPLPCAAIGAESSLEMVHYGHSCSS